MESSTADEAARATRASTVAGAFRQTVEARPDDVAVRTRDDSVSLTWHELHERVKSVAAGLAARGVRRGDTVALLLSNRPEFHIADLAVMVLGGTSFSIYSTYAPNQIQFVVSDAAARVAIVERALLDGLLAARADLPDLEHVIVVDADESTPLGDGVESLADVEADGIEVDFDASIDAIEPDDVLTLIYTSGTTGPPKGVELTHENVLAAAAVLEQVLDFPPGARVLSWLPAAHIAERAAHHYLPVVYGFTVVDCDDPRQVLSYLPDVRPHWFFAVPRIWEKLKAGLETMVAGLPDEQRAGAERALEQGIAKVRLEQAGEPVPEDLAAAVAQADEQLFANLRRQFGFDEIAAVHVGAAPVSVEVLEFFHAIGIPVAELWGMSETTGAGTVNRPDHIKLGTVGPPVPGAEIKLADDGEVLLRGKFVTRGYRNLPEATAEAIDPDGWLHTGDIGEIDADGFLKIVDRKKEIIINAAGKNMSPANIEGTIKSASPLIGQVCVIGDRRPYNTALIVLDADFAPVWAGQQGLDTTDLTELGTDEAVRAEVQRTIESANERLARVEQIKKFHIVPGDWLPGGDELTPTMKLRRRPIGDKYAEAIEAMYE
jgi:long-subunit acyl-CoA synthetase (AMP-forming)